MLRIVVLLVILGLGSEALCQSTQFLALKAAHPDELAVMTEHSTLVTMEFVDDSLRVTSDVKEAVLFLKDQTDWISGRRIYGSHFHDIENLQAKTQVWEKNRYKDLNVSNLTKQREDDNSVFYDDSYFYPLAFPAATTGNIAVWSYKEIFRDPRFLSSFYFSDYVPQIAASYTVKATKGVQIGWTVMNDKENRVKFSQYEKGGFTYYQWVAENVPTFKREDNSPKLSYYVPQVIVYVKSYSIKGKTKILLEKLDDLYNWYYQIIEGIKPVSDLELLSVVNNIKVEETHEIDRVKKIFYWVQDNIRYIAFEDGMRGFVPHHPDYVYQKRYGDCKDMATLIVGMLQAAGIKSYHTWIGTRDLPYKYSELATPLVDNHMIATYIDENNNYYFLDGTSNYTPVFLPSSMIQGKEALVAKGPHLYEIKTVPEILPEVNVKRDTVHMTIESSELSGAGEVKLFGYQKVDGSYDFDKTREEAIKENVVSWVLKGSNKFFLDSYQITNLHDKDLPLQVEYKFRIKDYVNRVGDEVYVNMNLDKVFYNGFIQQDRKLPLIRNYRFQNEVTYVLEIPVAYKVEYLPGNSTFNGPQLSFEKEYSISGDKVILRSKLSSTSMMVTADQFNEWNKAVKELSSALKESLILKKKP